MLRDTATYHRVAQDSRKMEFVTLRIGIYKLCLEVKRPRSRAYLRQRKIMHLKRYLRAIQGQRMAEGVQPDPCNKSANR